MSRLYQFYYILQDLTTIGRPSGLGGLDSINFDEFWLISGVFWWISVDLGVPGGLRVSALWRAVAASGGLWQPVAGCGGRVLPL